MRWGDPEGIVSCNSILIIQLLTPNLNGKVTLPRLSQQRGTWQEIGFSKGAQEQGSSPCFPKPGEGGPLKWLLTCIRSLTGIGSSSHTLSKQPRLEQTEADAWIYLNTWTHSAVSNKNSAACCNCPCYWNYNFQRQTGSQVLLTESAIQGQLTTRYESVPSGF